MTFSPRKLFLDLETRSRCDLKAAGARRYSVDPSTQITTASWKWAGASAASTACNIRGLEHLASNSMADFVRAVNDADHIVAHNINFDANVIFSTLGPCGLSLDKFDCTMGRAQRVSLPGGLDELCDALQLPGKSFDGHRIVMATCKPRKDGTFNEDPTLFRQLLAYNVQDVHCLESVDRMLPPLPPEELEIWRRTWKKNARGLPLDLELCRRIAAKRAEIEQEIANDLRETTGGSVTAVTQRGRILDWLKSQNVNIPNTQRATIESWLDIEDMPFDAWRVLTILFESGGSAPTKAQALLDRQVGGCFQDATRYFGARSGRGTSEGCFGRGTLVLTDSGWKAIVNVTRTDRVWDGAEWVTHGGLLCQGFQETTQIYGLTTTESHLVLSGATWTRVQELKRAPWRRIRALATGLDSLLSLVLCAPVKSMWSSSVTAGLPSAWSCGKMSKHGELKTVTNADASSTQLYSVTCGATKTSRSGLWPCGYLTSFPVSTAAVPIQMTKTGLTTVAGVSASLLNGLLAWCGAKSKLEKFLTRSGAASFWSTFSGWKTTVSRATSLTALITIEATNRVTFILSAVAETQRIGARRQLLKKTGCFSEVYDLSNCGPKSQFMILSSAGPLLVHNCNMFNIARPSGKHNPTKVILRLKAEPSSKFSNTELSDVLRGTIVAPKDQRILDCDLSNIELRLSLWLANDQEKLALIRSGRDLYAATAGAALGLPNLTKHSHPKERQCFKKVVLMGGFACGENKLYNSMKTDKDLPYELRKELTRAQVGALHAGYRDNNWHLQRLWKELDAAVRAALYNRGAVVPAAGGKVTFHWRRDVDVLDFQLPSGRTIPHYKPHFSEEGEMMFWRAKYGRMMEQKMYGGSITEILCQSMARDVIVGVEHSVEAELPDVMLLLDIYDSIVALAPASVANERKEQILQIMRRNPAWSEGLPLDAEGTVTDRMEK